MVITKGTDMEFKIPFYNLVNMFLIGFIFILGFFFLNPDLLKIILLNIKFYDISSSLILLVLLPLSYEIGLIINRLGSLLENILKTENKYTERNMISRIFQFTWRKYELYQKTEKIDPFVTVLSREYALSRNSLTLFFLLFFVSVYNKDLSFTITTFLLSLLFYFSMRKHARKIVSRIDYSTTKNHKL